ncbi:hypothetical protein JW824_14420 [bacterium]|nr:hypothetical protein [bacterium]
MKKIFIFSLLFLFSYGGLQSQEAPSRIGIGLSLSEVRRRYFYIDEDEITHNIFIPINIGKSFRFEPQLGFDSYSEEDEYDKSCISYLQLGIGIFPILWRNKTILYFGGRLCFLFSSYTYTYKYYGDTKWRTNKESDFGFLFVAPAIGGEYFVCEKLSLGGEIQLKFLSNNSENTKHYFTHTLFFTRFYF